jgi:hypothetical protein
LKFLASLLPFLQTPSEEFSDIAFVLAPFQHPTGEEKMKGTGSMLPMAIIM